MIDADLCVIPAETRVEEQEGGKGELGFQMVMVLWLDAVRFGFKFRVSG